jgi:hypothetical protein
VRNNRTTAPPEGGEGEKMDYEFYDYDEDRYREVAEYLSEIDKIVRGEVVKKHSDLLDKITHLTAEANRLKRLCGKCQSAQRDFDARVKKEADRVKEEWITKVFGPFRPRQTVWVVGWKSESKACQLCRGDKTVTAQIGGMETKMKCPSCDGNGKVREEWYEPNKTTVNKIYASIDNWNGPHHSTYVDCSRDYSKNDSEIYTTEAACAEACTKLTEERRQKSRK